MALDFTTAALVQDVAIRAGIPIAQELFSAGEILRICDGVTTGLLVPLIMKHRKGHFLVYLDTTTTTATTYDLPTDALDDGLKNVTFIDANGFESPGVPIDLDAEIEDAYGSVRDTVIGLGYRRYYVREQVILYPRSHAGDTLRQHYHRRPGKLCRTAAYTYNDGSEAAEAVQVVSVNTTTGAITCTASSVPATITISTRVSVVRGVPPFRRKVVSALPTARTDTIVTLGSDIALVAAAGIVAGDWLCLAGETPIPQLPPEVFGILAEAATCKIHQSLGDTESLTNSKASLKDEWDQYVATYGNRVEEAPRKAEGGDILGDWI